MADIRIKDLATTATTTASDDFMAVDGATNGTRKLSAATPAFLTSVTTPSLTSPASTNLTLAGGAGNSSIILTPAGTGNVGIGTTGPNYKSTIDSTTGNYFASALLSAGIGSSGNWVGQLYGYTGSTYQKAATIFESSDANGRGKFHIALNGAATSANVSVSDAKLTVDYSGTVSIASTTAGSSGAGALVVTGGISVGAASYFANLITGPSTASFESLRLASMGFGIGTAFAGGQSEIYTSSTNPLGIGTTGNAVFRIYTNSTLACTFSAAQAATFAGAVTAGGAITANVTASNYISIVSNATNKDAAFKSGDGTNNWYAGLVGGSFGTDGAYRILEQGVGTARLTIATTTGAATFAGAVSGAAATFRPASDGVGLTLNQANSASAGWSFSPLNSGSLTVTRIGGVIAMTCDLNGNTAFNTSTTQTFGAVVISSGNSLKLGNAYVAGAVVGTGSITIQDSTGTTYRIPVLV